jgi:hypothetical protein
MTRDDRYIGSVLAVGAVMPLPVRVGRRLSPPVVRGRLGSIWPWRGNAIFVDRGRDRIDRRLNLQYSIDLIFRLSFLVTAGQRFSQRPTLGEQLIPRFLERPHMVLGHGHRSQSCKGPTIGIMASFDSNGAPRKRRKRPLVKDESKKVVNPTADIVGSWLRQQTGDGDERSNIFGSDRESTSRTFGCGGRN